MRLPKSQALALAVCAGLLFAGLAAYVLMGEPPEPPARQELDEVRDLFVTVPLGATSEEREAMIQARLKRFKTEHPELEQHGYTVSGTDHLRISVKVRKE